jgi:hypothetical protein
LFRHLYSVLRGIPSDLAVLRGEESFNDDNTSFLKFAG